MDAETQALYDSVKDARREVKLVADGVNRLRTPRRSDTPQVAMAAPGEAVANITLAYRALEDASMRLGKALQALDGGVSVYDRATTVGA